MSQCPILLVDDQPGKLLSYQAILEELGEELILAHSAQEALSVLLRVDVALVLMDVCMPDLDGFQLVELIRRHPRFEKLPVIFVSGVNLSDLDHIRGYATGAVDYVPVPVIPDILRAKVRVFLELHRKTRQLEDLNRELEDRIAQRTAQLEASTARCQESEQRLRMALGSARAGAWDLDLDTGELHSSPELLALLGIPADTPTPDLPAAMAHVHPDDQQQIIALIEAMSRGRGLAELEFRVVPDLGQPSQVLWVRLTGEVIEGAARTARGILQDVTSHKRAELALEQEARHKDEFLATLAHELRNPLAAMGTGVRLLRLPELPAESRERTHALLQRQMSHLCRLVDDLLDMSRISRGTISLLREPVDLAALVRTSLQGLGSPQLVATLPEEGMLVSGDSVRLAQVVTNLLDNARKFSPPGGRIEIRVEEIEGQAELRVRDCGRGIAPEDLERVFELFTQVEPGSSPSGLGLGLALVRRLVELHGGQVWARSEGRGQGSEFVVRLPLLPGLEAPQSTSWGLPAPCSAPSQRVLVVDDNHDAADTLAELLQQCGHEVRTAYDGLQACELGASFEPQLVLLDLGMPGLDGYATARRIRHLPWGQTARLYALTGWGASADRQRTAAAGFDGHLVKPVDLDELLSLLPAAGHVPDPALAPSSSHSVGESLSP
jgi:signal transduction histidine kinase